MIVETMTWEQVGREIALDFKESDIAARACKRVVANGNKYRRAYGNRTGLHIFPPFSIKTIRNNIFFVLPIVDDKKYFENSRSNYFNIHIFSFESWLLLCSGFTIQLYRDIPFPPYR